MANGAHSSFIAVANISCVPLMEDVASELGDFAYSSGIVVSAKCDIAFSGVVIAASVTVAPFSNS